MQTPILAEVRKGSLVELLVPEAQEFCCSFSFPVGDSGGPLIIHKRSRFIQVSLPLPSWGQTSSGHPSQGETPSQSRKGQQMWLEKGGQSCFILGLPLN